MRSFLLPCATIGVSLLAVWTFREPSLGRHVRRELMRNTWLDFTP